MKEVFINAKNFLPLIPTYIEWNDPELLIGGEGWNFCTLCSWRVIDGKRILFSCTEQPSQIIENLKKIPIISITPQSTQLPMDFVFAFSNGYKLEIFSTLDVEPWILKFPVAPVYVACPTDPNYV